MIYIPFKLHIYLSLIVNIRKLPYFILTQKWRRFCEESIRSCSLRTSLDSSDMDDDEDHEDLLQLEDVRSCLRAHINI